MFMTAGDHIVCKTYTKSGLATPVMMAKKTALTCIFFQTPTQAEKFDRKAVINFEEFSKFSN
jgi:hypothetical protein